MCLDYLWELGVAVQKRELDDGIRSRPAQAARFEQPPLLFGVDELSDVDVGADLVPRFELRDLGIDVVGASFSRERDAMVAVLDKVRAANLEDRGSPA